MAATFILNDSANNFTEKIISELKVNELEYYQCNSDGEIDDLVTKIFHQNEIDKLIIPVALGEVLNNQMGIRIGLHIRLSSKIGDKNKVPIVFVSSHSLDTLLLIRNDRHALIVVTPACTLCEQDIEDIRANLLAIAPISNSDIGPKFLDRIIVDKLDTMGPHSLANEWGVYQLDKIANLHALPPSAPAFIRSKELYFKYLRAKNNYTFQTSGSSGTSGTANTINSVGNRILYIDDEGDKGWVDVLKKIFHGGNFIAETGKNKSETEFFTSIRNQIKLDWDLVLLDLRLLPWKEDVGGVILPIDSYSGTQILKEIKTANPGTQVLIFTASNKAWNMRQLLRLEADGYYIKESPDYLIPDHLSLKHYEEFKDQVKTCFDKAYLRKIYSAQVLAISKTVNQNAAFISFSEIGLQNAFEILRLNRKEIAYLTYFQIIEKYAEANFDTNNKSIFDLGGVEIFTRVSQGLNRMKYHEDLINGSYYEKVNSSDRISTKALGKLSFILAFKFGKDDQYLRELGGWVKVRNDIAHEGSSILLTIPIFFKLIEMIQLFREHN